MTQGSSPPQPVGSPAPSDLETAPSNPNHERQAFAFSDPNNTTPIITNRAKAFVLAGCSILQIPIWGFAMTYGIFQEYYTNNVSAPSSAFHVHGSPSGFGIIGTTSNGVMYLSMPLLFALFTRRYAHFRRITAIAGVVLACLGFLLSSFSTEVWHLVITQGVLAALGCALVYTPTTLVLGEYYTNSKRALAYGIVLSCKNITGSVCPYLVQALLDGLGLRNTMRVWAAIVAGTSLVAVMVMPLHPPGMKLKRRNSDSTPDSSCPNERYRPRKIPWSFLHHSTFYISAIATMLQSSGYGLPQTYLNTYAHTIASVPASTSTLLITLFNAPGIISSSFFGLLADNKKMPLSASATAFISALSAALAAFLLWGLASGSSEHGSMPLLVLFAMIYGFFAGGYSATWGGTIKEMEADAVSRNEAIDSGMVYGLLNGARGIGYVGGGLVGVQLLKVGGSGGAISSAKFGYGTSYGPLIVYTGLATAFGGWSVLFKCKGLRRWT